MAYINKIGLANAPYKHAQGDIKTFALKQYNVPEKYIHRISSMYDNSMINYRHSAIGDFTENEHKPFLFKSSTEEASTEDRMQVFFDVAPKMGEKAVRSIIDEKSLQNLTHIITVSCTGISAPGLEFNLIESLNLPANLTRIAINLLGCYAGFHALKLAKAICAEQKNASVLIVDIELCTLHFQKDFTMDNVASTLLFADGAAAVLVSNNSENSLYKLSSFYTEVDLKGKKDMAWQIGPTGFKMTLSSYIPSIIGENILPMMEHAMGNKKEINHWAIHPGGKKILQECARVLQLSGHDLSVSYEILREYGNMSSVTIFYVLDALLKKIKAPGEKVFSGGF